MGQEYLSADDILNRADVEEKDVYVPEWDGYVRIKGLTKEAQTKARRDAMVDGEFDEDKFQMLMLVYSVVEPKLNKKNAEKLWQKSVSAVDKVLREVLWLSGVTEDQIKEAEKSFRTGVQ